ncbi:uncharacterized protein EV154DRAFT_483231 [Mucor mucedo]|uniref:uncharacterized protein n=1 Tax=Mucor mucedo TaxID=29922 RepID=UPI00221F6904|nr:uncharacterized protein EV154DRAFT_483231 [Mucor mucedo]KAI7889361.1 hypothetical protein EV154DRAFT_483231 [Mucor mucedo]
MSRTPIYTEVEKLIILQKCVKLEKVKSDSAKESSTTQTPTRTSKKSTKRSRQVSTSAASYSRSKCSSYQEEGDDSARSRQYQTIKEILCLSHLTLSFKAHLFVNFFSETPNQVDK